MDLDFRSIPIGVQRKRGEGVMQGEIEVAQQLQETFQDPCWGGKDLVARLTSSNDDKVKLLHDSCFPVGHRRGGLS